MDFARTQCRQVLERLTSPKRPRAQADDHFVFKGVPKGLLKFSDSTFEFRNDTDAFETAIFSEGVTTGKWYYEVRLCTNKLMQIGWFADEPSKVAEMRAGSGAGDVPHSYAFDGHRQLLWWAGEDISFGEHWQEGQHLTCFLDLTAVRFFALGLVSLIFRAGWSGRSMATCSSFQTSRLPPTSCLKRTTPQVSVPTTLPSPSLACSTFK